MRCQEVTRLATDYDEGSVSFWTAFQIRRHLAECAACRTRYTQQTQTQQALREVGRASGRKELPASSKAQALQTYREFISTQRDEVGSAGQALFRDAQQGLPRVWPAAVVTGLAAVLGGLGAHHYAADLPTRLAAVLLAAVACGLVVVAQKYGFLAGVFALLGATTYALLGASSVALPAGSMCTVHELATGALALGALVLGRGQALLPRATLVGVAAAGALAGDATLHVICPGAESLGHTLIFHVGGVIAAGGLLGSLAARILGPTRVARGWL